MTESAEPGKPRDEGVTANLMGIFVYLGPSAVIAIAVVFAVVDKEAPRGPTAMFWALAISLAYLTFIGGARWGVMTCRDTAPNVYNLLASTVALAAGSVTVFYKLWSPETIDNQTSLVIVALAFVPLLVLDGLIVFGQNGQKHEHPELRFLGSVLTVLALVAALIVFWKSPWVPPNG